MKDELLREQSEDKLQNYVDGFDRVLQNFVRKNSQYTDSFAYGFIDHNGQTGFGACIQGEPSEKDQKHFTHILKTYFNIQDPNFRVSFYNDKDTFGYMAQLKRRFMKTDKQKTVLVYPTRLEQHYKGEWEQGVANLKQQMAEIVAKYKRQLKITDSFFVVDKLTYQTQLFLVSDVIMSDRELNLIVHQIDKQANLFTKIFVEAKRSNYPLGMTIDIFGEDFSEGEHERYVVYRNDAQQLQEQWTNKQGVTHEQLVRLGVILKRKYEGKVTKDKYGMKERIENITYGFSKKNKELIVLVKLGPYDKSLTPDIHVARLQREILTRYNLKTRILRHLNGDLPHIVDEQEEKRSNVRDMRQKDVKLEAIDKVLTNIVNKNTTKEDGSRLAGAFVFKCRGKYEVIYYMTGGSINGLWDYASQLNKMLCRFLSIEPGSLDSETIYDREAFEKLSKTYVVKKVYQLPERHYIRYEKEVGAIVQKTNELIPQLESIVQEFGLKDRFIYHYRNADGNDRVEVVLLHRHPLNASLATKQILELFDQAGLEDNIILIREDMKENVTAFYTRYKRAYYSEHTTAKIILKPILKTGLTKESIREKLHEVAGKYKDQIDVVYKSPQLVIVAPKTSKMASKYSRNSEWCSQQSMGFCLHRQQEVLFRFLWKDGYRARLNVRNGGASGSWGGLIPKGEKRGYPQVGFGRADIRKVLKGYPGFTDELEQHIKMIPGDANKAVMDYVKQNELNLSDAANQIRSQIQELQGSYPNLRFNTYVTYDEKSHNLTVKWTIYNNGKSGEPVGIFSVDQQGLIRNNKSTNHKTFPLEKVKLWLGQQEKQAKADVFAQGQNLLVRLAPNYGLHVVPTKDGVELYDGQNLLDTWKIKGEQVVTQNETVSLYKAKEIMLRHYNELHKTG